MVDLVGLGTLASGASGLASVFGLGGKRSTAREDFWNERAWKHARDQFTQGIRYRVKDARLAGIHPLFALGANIPGGSPSFAVGSDRAAGSSFSRGLETVGRAATQYGLAVGGRQERRAAAAAQAHAQANDNIRTLSSSKLDSAQAAYYSALAAKAAQEVNSTGTARGVGPESVVRRTPLEQYQGRTLTNRLSGGGQWRTGNPGLIQKLEDDYGDLVAAIGGIAPSLGDALANLAAPQYSQKGRQGRNYGQSVFGRHRGPPLVYRHDGYYRPGGRVWKRRPPRSAPGMGRIRRALRALEALK